jgi:hypothetical protein
MLSIDDFLRSTMVAVSLPVTIYRCGEPIIANRQRGRGRLSSLRFTRLASMCGSLTDSPGCRLRALW